MKAKDHSASLPERLYEFISREGLILPNEKILVAFSGGADSVALLSMLHTLSERLGITVCAAHLNHGIRGDEADRDEDFCAETCKKLGISLEISCISVPAEAEKTGEGLEECARRLRYDFLRECAKKHGCERIATAHHADDNVETILLHLIRGAGASGLVGISPKRDNIIRPLLPFRKKELLEYLEGIGESFVFDSTNNDVTMTRNKIRHQLLDTVYEINPRADAAFYNMSRLIEEDNKYLLSVAKSINKDAPLSVLRELPSPILTRFLQLKYSEYVNARAEKSKTSEKAHTLSYVHVTPIAQFIKTGVTNADFSLPGKICAHVNVNGVQLTDTKKAAPSEYEIPLKAGENNISQYRYKILITNDKNVAEEWQNIYKLSIPTSVNSDTIFGKEAPFLFVRSKKTGDSYVYGGHNRNVRRRLIDLKIPAYKRESLPCICDKEGIIWVPNLRVADRVRPQNGKEKTYIIYVPLDT